MNLADLIVCQSKFTDELVTYLLGQDNKIPRTIIYNGANKEIIFTKWNEKFLEKVVKK